MPMAAHERTAEALDMQLGTGTVAIEDDNGLARLRLSGEFDLANVPGLERAVKASLWPAHHVLVDLREVTHLDSQLLHWLRRLRREVAERGGRLLVVPSAHARRVLAVTSLTDLFDLVEA